MYVVTVVFDIRPDHRDEFLRAVCEQASSSIEQELDCHQFDVACSDSNPDRILLYELYTDKAAFDRHLKTPHFQAFSQRVGDMVTSKVVETWSRKRPS
ncbi:MAG: putative quinol monooxygenase [Pseudomonadota bacterium]